jgi:hypothetical protein
MTSLTTLEGLDYLNTSETKNMSQMFQNCTSLTMLDLSPLTVNVDDATQIFAGCTNLTTIFVESQWNVNYEGHDGMFDNCLNLVGARTYSEGYTDGYWADDIVGYFTTTPYVIWCRTDKTLYFAAPRHRLEVGEEWNGQRIAALWKGIKVINSNETKPEWTTEAATCKRAVFDQTFADQRPRRLNRWFSDCWGLEQIEGMENLNTSETTEANHTFFNCYQLRELDVNGFDMSKMISAKYMFANCNNLWTIWCDNTWNIPEAANMFNGCYRLHGAVNFSSAIGVDGTMANPETGYFTSTPIVELKDDQENYTDLFAQYEGRRVHVRYDRKFPATQNADGSWNRKAYTVCLPYNKTLYHENSIGQMALYTLACVTDDGHFIFVEYGQAELKAGHPYVIVVNEGEISMDADNVKLTSELYEGDPVFANFDDWFERNNDKQIGWWKSISHRIYAEDCEPLQIYAQQKSDGRWLRYRDFQTGYHVYWLSPLRAYFQAIESTGRNVYYPQYGYMPDGPAGVRQILDFPAEEFDGDDIGIDVPVGIQSAFNSDNANDSHRYYDLQGRPLNSMPAKGMYIDIQQGKQVRKVIK